MALSFKSALQTSLVMYILSILHRTGKFPEAPLKRTTEIHAHLSIGII